MYNDTRELHPVPGRYLTAFLLNNVTVLIKGGFEPLNYTKIKLTLHVTALRRLKFDGFNFFSHYYSCFDKQLYV